MDMFLKFRIYDETLPIVAAQLLFTVGVTSALAFELPSEPIYHITEKLRDRLVGAEEDYEDDDDDNNDETTTMASNSDDTDNSRRKDKNRNQLHYIDYKQKNYYDSMNKHRYYYSQNYNNNKYYHIPSSPNYYFNDRLDNYTMNFNNKFNQQLQSPIFVTTKPKNKTKNVWSKVMNKFVNEFGQKVLTKKLNVSKKKKKLGNLFLRNHHRVYPVFGKRSVDDQLTDEDKFYIEHHRTTRRGKNGSACVLRALCETAQKNQRKDKASFLLEILRAVFSLPHQVEPYQDSSHKQFDDAHFYLQRDCSQVFSECTDSIWSPKFNF
ncbi:CLUMA_CG018494, isoform A [Clunio marinus]|uniref:CLUMA_CG018494, isoform A n=1 Tax=Clunio marinus TaxID=568069 RepID=A0A1J1IZU6_9DIPT|nr:CLUMA_CG018494, isoform A [Clunio marinus]